MQLVRRRAMRALCRSRTLIALLATFAAAALLPASAYAATCSDLNGNLTNVPSISGSGSRDATLNTNDVVTLNRSQGTIILYDNDTGLNNVILSSGTSQSFTVPPVSNGHNFSIRLVDAQYAGSWSCTPATPPQQSQTITFPNVASAPKVGQPVTLGATATSGLTVSYSASPSSVCTVSGNTLTPVAVGLCTVTASQAGNTAWSAAPNVVNNFVIDKGTQTITVAPITDKKVNDAAFAVSATSSVPNLTSSLVISAGPSSICTYANGKVTPVAAGVCTVGASSGGDSNYGGGNGLTTFNITRATQTLTIAPIASKKMTDAAFDVSATSSVPSLTSSITLSAAPSSVCTYANGKITPVGAGNCTVTASSNGDATYDQASNTLTFAINLDTQTLTITPIGAKKTTDAAFAVSATSSVSALSGGITFSAAPSTVCTYASGKITPVGTGNCTLTANSTGNGTYASASATWTFGISLDTQTITIAPIAAKKTTDAAFTVSATSSVPALTGGISLTAAPNTVCTYANGSVTPVGVGTCALTATSSGNGIYAQASATLSFTIGLDPQTITLRVPDTRAVHEGPFDVTATSSENLLVTLTAAPSSICTMTGRSVTPVAAGSCVVTASAAGTTTVAAAQVSRTVVITKRSDVAPQLIAKQSAARVQSILGNQMGTNRQVDRLMDFGGGAANTAGAGSSGTTGAFTQQEQRALDVATGTATTSRLGLGLNGANASPLAQGLGLRPTYDDDLTSPMRTRGPGGVQDTRNGMSVAGLSLFAGDSGAFNFSTSLRDVTRAAQQQEDQRLRDDPTAAAMGFTGARSRALDRRPNPLDVWFEGRFLRLNDGRNGADLQGFSGLFGTGIDYVFNRALLAGMSLSYDVSGQRSSAQGTESRGNGWLIGPYATVRLSDHLFWQSRAAWGRASNEVSPDATTTDSFTSSRWLASSKLTGRYQMGPWQLRPSVSVAYMEETSQAYTSGNGAEVPGVKTRVGTASAGPEISYQYRVNPDILIEPRAGMEAIWTFAHDISVGGNSALVAGDAIGPEGARGRAEIGLRTLIVGGTVIDVSGAYDGIGAGDYNTVTGRAVLRMPLN